MKKIIYFESQSGIGVKKMKKYTVFFFFKHYIKEVDSLSERFFLTIGQ